MIDGGSLLFNWDKKDLQQERQRIARCLLDRVACGITTTSPSAGLCNASPINSSASLLNKDLHMKEQRNPSKKQKNTNCALEQPDDERCQYKECEGNVDQQQEPFNSSRKGYTMIIDLPDIVLQEIFKEVVLSDGDMAYQTLALVSKKFNSIVSRKSFKKKCHLAWLLSLRPMSFWQRNRIHFKEFCLVPCLSCQTIFKEEDSLYVGGHGKRGEFLAVYDNISHPGYCSHFCQMCDQAQE